MFGTMAAMFERVELVAGVRLVYTPAIKFWRKAMSITTTESGLQIEEIKLGEGDTAASGQFVSVHYTGWLTDGKKFDSSKDRDEPFEFPLGQRNVIAGWDEGVQGMRIGGIRKLTIPPQLGYGARGAGGVIPPNATLVFEVELLNIS